VIRHLVPAALYASPRCCVLCTLRSGNGAKIKSVPELSRFFGIIIRMFSEAGAQHHAAHFHAYYQDEIGVFSINPVDLIAGTLPQRQRQSNP
jgi:hypothetical protein